MRLLITGAGGRVAGTLPAQLREAGLGPAEVFALSRGELDITDPVAVGERVAEIRPDVILNCAAFARVEGCEKDSERAWAVNAVGPGYLAEAASRTGAYLLHLSTDYVFDGGQTTPYREGDEPNPLSVYGKSKAEGEKRVLSLCPRACVVRTAWVYSREFGFPAAILRDARARGSCRATEQRGSPTYAPDLCAAMLMLARERAAGLFHAAGAGECSRDKWARETLRLVGLHCPVLPLEMGRAGEGARPAYSALSCQELEALGYRMRPWEEALAACLAVDN